MLQKLREEFHFFIGPEVPRPQAEITLFLAPPPAVPPMLAVKLLENCTVYRQGRKRYLDYFGEALTIQDEHRRRVEIYSTDGARLFELAFLAVHSLLGEMLDLTGLVRLHGLGISLKRTSAVVLLPSKGGKSTLLTNVLRDPDVKIISDDMPLCDRRGRIHPFPSKISLETPPKEGPLSRLTWHEFRRRHYPPKWTASLGAIPERIDQQPEDKKLILVAGFRLSSGSSSLFPVERWKMLGPLLEHMVMGFGLPQILEMFLRFDLTDLPKLAHHGVVRAIYAFNLARNAKCYHFHLGPDRAQNSKLLLELMHEQEAT